MSSTKIKKSRYSKLQEQLNKLENKFDILDDDLLEFKWEIDDIKKTLSLIKSSNTKFFKNSGTLSESDLSDNRGARLHINLIYLRLKAVESELRDKKAKCKCELPKFETDNSDTSDEMESRSFASSNCSDILPDVIT
ncbi:5151_t:CDS:2, partial [Diversispora eburnea]